MKKTFGGKVRLIPGGKYGFECEENLENWNDIRDQTVIEHSYRRGKESATEVKKNCEKSNAKITV